MKTLATFFVGCAIGVVVAAFTGRPMFPATTRLTQAIAAPTGPTFEEKYVGSIIDQIQFALVVRGVCPELAPEWIESQIAGYTTELQGALRTNVLADDALLMIKAYYQRNGITVSTEIDTICTGQQREIKADAINKRLSVFDGYIAARKGDHSANLRTVMEAESTNEM